jgi:hypothetical protein
MSSSSATPEDITKNDDKPVFMQEAEKSEQENKDFRFDPNPNAHIAALVPLLDRFFGSFKVKIDGDEVDPTYSRMIKEMRGENKSILEVDYDDVREFMEKKMTDGNTEFKSLVEAILGRYPIAVKSGAMSVIAHMRNLMPDYLEAVRDYVSIGISHIPI